ncbi:MAG: AlkZ family DNA glycosylase [Acidobacteria bacterium]|nr:AlkZ family DNA glycosylase [Acidobacteriota bacterium]MBI3422509.1 AlkZ family DNA glycosylase [Acidobacteriota bacterium]
MKTTFPLPQVLAFRLARHHLTDAASAELTGVCRDIGGLQAQINSAARLAAWARVPGLTQTEIQTALYQQRALVRTSCMRQTLHLITAADFALYINALRQSRVTALLRVAAKFGVTRQHADALNACFLAALSGGPLPRRALLERIQPLVGQEVRAWMNVVWGIQVFRLALVEGLICYGPDQGAEGTYVRVDQWLPAQLALEPAAALAELLRRYLRTYGPATPKDFAKWTGNPMPEIKAAWAAVQDELVEVSMAGTPGWLLRDDLPALQRSAPVAAHLRLLPSFDPWVLGHADKNQLVDAQHYKRIFRSAAWVSPVVLLNGRAAGVWSHRRQGKRLLVEIEPFEKFSKPVRKLIEAEAARLGAFLGAEAAVH